MLHLLQFVVQPWHRPVVLVYCKSLPQVVHRISLDILRACVHNPGRESLRLFLRFDASSLPATVFYIFLLCFQSFGLPHQPKN